MTTAGSLPSRTGCAAPEASAPAASGWDQSGGQGVGAWSAVPPRHSHENRGLADGPGPPALRRILVDAIENAGITQVAIGRGEAPAELFWTQSREHRQQRLPM